MPLCPTTPDLFYPCQPCLNVPKRILSIYINVSYIKCLQHRPPLLRIAPSTTQSAIKDKHRRCTAVKATPITKDLIATSSCSTPFLACINNSGVPGVTAGYMQVLNLFHIGHRHTSRRSFNVSCILIELVTSTETLKKTFDVRQKWPRFQQQSQRSSGQCLKKSPCGILM